MLEEQIKGIKLIMICWPCLHLYTIYVICF